MAQEVAHEKECTNKYKLSTNKIRIIAISIDMLIQKERNLTGSRLWTINYRPLITAEKVRINLPRDEDLHSLLMILPASTGVSSADISPAGGSEALCTYDTDDLEKLQSLG